MSRTTLRDKLHRALMRRTVPAFTPGDRHVTITRVETPMSDGTKLVGDLLMPDDVKPGTPTIVMRTPYGRSVMFMARLPLPLASHGYPVLLQSCRGTAGSEGKFRPQLDDQSDGIDTLRWVRKQPWFTGRLATAGGSYLGYVQWAVAGKLAREEPETAAEAMSLSVTMPDFGAITWDRGAYSLRNALTWSQMVTAMGRGGLAMLSILGPNKKLQRALDTHPLRDGDLVASGERIDWYQDWLDHEDLRDDYWTQQSHLASVTDVTAPIVMTTGWYDIFLPWQIRTYELLAAAGRPPRLTIGPWNHSSNDSVATDLTQTMRHFDEVFHGIPNPQTQPVRFHRTGDGTWHEVAAWPPPGTVDVDHFLHADGTLDTSRPAADEAPTAYVYDPADPTPSTGGPEVQGDSTTVDDTEHEKRADVVTFTSAPLDSDLDVTGTAVATVWLRSDRPSVDVFVRITDVHPDGRSMSVTDAIRRVGSPATAHLDPERTADGAWPVEVELWPTGHRFRAGHRIRIQVSSGAHPRYARNTGSGKPAVDDAELHVAHQEVLHEAGRASGIRLPVWKP